MTKNKIYNINNEGFEMTVLVEEVSKLKDLMDWYDGQYGVCAEDESFEFVMKDGTIKVYCAGDELDKINRRNVKSAVYANPADYIVYGEYEVSENGVVYAM